MDGFYQNSKKEKKNKDEFLQNLKVTADGAINAHPEPGQLTEEEIANLGIYRNIERPISKNKSF